MRRLILLFLQSILLCALPLLGQNAFEVYFNEVRSRDTGTDDVEFIELIGPAGTNLQNFRIAHHDGSPGVNGEVWSHTIGTHTLNDDGITDQGGNSLGFYVYGAAAVTNVDESVDWVDQHLENNADGIILYDPSGNILDAVAWGGTGDLNSTDPGTVVTLIPSNADSFLHVTVIEEDNENSLQAPNLVFNDDGTGWANGAATPGAVNFNQTSGDITLPVSLSNFSVASGDGNVTLSWLTQSELNNLGFEVLRSQDLDAPFDVIASYTGNPDLEGQLNSDTEHQYAYVDRTVLGNQSYFYKLVDVNIEGLRTEHGPIEVLVFEDVVDGPTIIPSAFSMKPAYPNPFNPGTTIEVNVSATAGENFNVSLVIYDLLGRQVKTLLNGSLAAQTTPYQIEWDSTNDVEEGVAAGVYYAVFIVDGFYFETQKLVYLK